MLEHKNSSVNEKLRHTYETTLKEVQNLEKDTMQIVDSQWNELTKKSLEKVEDTKRLKEAMKEEAEAMKEAGDYFYDLYRRCKNLADEIETRVNEASLYDEKNKTNSFFKVGYTNAMVDYKEKERNHFAKGATIYKYFWIFFFGCIGGVIVETIWCLLTRGYYESRVGLIWGPFNLVYGLGALFLTYALYPYRNRSPWFSFGGGFIVGSITEYLCSLFQEFCFGSVSWDYSQIPFNLNGRICVLYSIFWGILGVLWIKVIYPKMALWILKIPNKLGKGLTYGLFIFMLVNSLMSGFVVYRWTERLQKKPAENQMERWADLHYPDEKLEKIYANLEFVED